MHTDELTAANAVRASAADSLSDQAMLASFRQVPLGLLHLDRSLNIVFGNERLARLLERSAAVLPGMPLSALLAASDSAQLYAELRRLFKAPGTALRSEIRLRRPDASLCWARLTAYCVVDAAGAAAHLACWLGDLDQSKQLEDMLQLSNRALAASSNGVLITDAGHETCPIMFANPAFCAMTGYSQAEVIGRNCRFLQGEDREQPAIAVLRAALAERRDVRVVLRNYRKDGSLFWNDLFVSPVPDAQGEITHFIGILNDITALKENEERLAYQANHDKLTGLPNRRLFHARLQQAIAQAAKGGAACAVLCVGVDNVSLVNASLGHAAGDALLVGVAGRLLQCVGAADTVSRHGSDEFIVLLGKVDEIADVSRLCRQIFAAMAEPHQLEGQQVHANCSIGITLCPQDGGDSATLLRYADMAVGRAREAGGNSFQYFSADMNERTVERVSLEAGLRLALAQDQLQVLYQPAADFQTGQVCSIEALVRWQHPVLGLVGAKRFIPVAEETGLTGLIGSWLLRRVCQSMRAWADAGLAPVRVTINLSPRQLRDRHLAGELAATLAEFGVPPARLGLEITETALMQDPQASAEALRQLKTLGVALMLDDFGTGYSSLSHLKRFPLDLVKIEGALARAVVSDPDSAALCKSIISMAHHLGIQVMAEGVETEAQCNFLRRNMCDQIQGYFFGAPTGAEEMADLLAARLSLPAHLLRIQRQPRTLLLVDDEQNIVSSLKRLLRRDDYKLLSANNGQEGLDILAQHPVDVIVSDQRMPGMLGADFLRKAKDLYPDTIRIMLSGYTELQSVTDAVNEGAIYKFLTKPWEDELLRGHIREAFRLKEISDDNERLNLELRTANYELASANRKMEELLQLKQQQITRDEISLNIARELLQFLPLAVIGLDDTGMVAFVNDSAAALFRGNGAILGEEAALVLPELFGEAEGKGAQRRVRLSGTDYDMLVHPMGAKSQSRGSLITLKRCEFQT